MTDVARIAQAIREAGLSGWLFYNQFHRDEISDLALGVPRASAQQPAVGVPRARPEGDPTRVVHAIEPGILDHLPGRLVRCTSRDDLFAAVGAACRPGRAAGCPVLDLVPGGLLPRPRHRAAPRAPRHRAGVVRGARRRLPRHARRGRGGLAPARRPRAARRGARSLEPDPVGRAGGAAVHEADVQEWIAGLFAEAGLVTDGPALVAAGEASADPHYEPVGRGRRLQPGDVVQLDLWAREPGERSVFADISWVGVLAPAPTAEQPRVFDAVRRRPRGSRRRDRDAGSPPGSRRRGGGRGGPRR